MDRILKYDKKTIKLIDKLIRHEFEIKSNSSEQYDFSILKDSWLGNVIHNTTVDNLLSFFRRHFDLVELYHSCGPSSLRPYYNIGMENLNVNRIEDELKCLLNHELTSEENTLFENGLINSRKFIKNMGWRGEICFHTDKRTALEQSGFSSFGGEYVQYILCQISSKILVKKIADFLARKRIPTLFTVRIPLDRFSNEALISYLHNVISIWIEVHVLKSYEFDYFSFNSTTHNSQKPIKPLYIHRHEHPTEWFDDGERIYCDKCKHSIPRTEK